MVRFIALLLAIAGGGFINCGFIYRAPWCGLLAGVCFFAAVYCSER